MRGWKRSRHALVPSTPHCASGSRHSLYQDSNTASCRSMPRARSCSGQAVVRHQHQRRMWTDHRGGRRRAALHRAGRQSHPGRLYGVQAAVDAPASSRSLSRSWRRSCCRTTTSISAYRRELDGESAMLRAPAGSMCARGNGRRKCWPPSIPTAIWPRACRRWSGRARVSRSCGASPRTRLSPGSAHRGRRRRQHDGGDRHRQCVVPGVLAMSLGTSGTLFAYAGQPVVDARGGWAAFCSSTGGWLPLICTMNCTVATETIARAVRLQHARDGEAMIGGPAPGAAA